MDNPSFKAIQGQLPRKRDLAQWKHEKFMHFFNFCLLFMSGEGEDTVIKVTEEKRKEIEGFLEMPFHPFQEFIYRVNQFLGDPESTSRKFYYKLAAMIRQVGAYLKQNPAIVTDEMRKLIGENPRLNWCLSTHKVIETKIGAEIVVPDSQETVGFERKNVGVAHHEKQYLESITKTTNLIITILDSIKKEDVEKMSVKDKIASLSKLSYIHGVAAKFKPNSQVFKQLNIYASGKDDLEKALLEFSKIDE